MGVDENIKAKKPTAKSANNAKAIKTIQPENKGTPKQGNAKKQVRRKRTELVYKSASVTHSFKTPETLKLANDYMDHVNDALVWIDMALDRLENEVVDLGQINKSFSGAVSLGKVHNKLKERVDGIEDMIKSEITMLKELKDINEVDLDIETHNVEPVKIKITSPLTLDLLRLMKLYDEAMDMAFELNLAGVFRREDKRDIKKKIEIELKAFCRVILGVKQFGQRIFNERRQAKLARQHKQANNTKTTPKAANN